MAQSRATGIIAAAMSDEAVTQVSIGDVVENPENPREDLGDLGELAASIESLGILQPLLVCSRDAFVAERPSRMSRWAGGLCWRVTGVWLPRARLAWSRSPSSCATTSPKRA